MTVMENSQQKALLITYLQECIVLARVLNFFDAVAAVVLNLFLNFEQKNVVFS